MSGHADVIAGRFRLLGPLGTGNMGEVHRAEDQQAASDSADRFVALKRILQSRVGTATSANAKVGERFQREVRIMRMLDHPGLPRIIDGGIDASELPYLAMELLDGRSLRDLSEEHPKLPIPWVAAVGSQIADGLAAAHAAGVIHRDLKPSNVMLLRGGLVKVIDFGMGLIVDDPEGRLTSTGATVGTVRYMAPEQFQAAAVGPAADLYALGCVLFELLTGTPPLNGATSLELANKHILEEPPSAILLRPDIPKVLARLVHDLLAKKPEDRPVDATTVRDLLRPLATSDETVAGWENFNPAANLQTTAVQPVPPPSNPEKRPGDGLDIFTVHSRLIDDYRAFTQGGTVIRDPRIAEFVTDDLNSKSQWPDPWVSLNPFFASGGSVTKLADDGVLHAECARIFQSGKSEGGIRCDGRPITFHKHQRDAIEAARTGGSYVLTTGTGSGKSLAYLVPIVDRVLRARAEEGPRHAKRVRAIVVYPMNALANSQLGELRKFLTDGYGEGNEPVTYARYTGQESAERREQIRKDPPDILLTNYVMLELMLTRPEDRKSLVRMATGLEFLVFDELHTYRGRQGADVALLIRRVREACQADQVQCVGTSATMSSEGSLSDQREVVADVASQLFGTEVTKANVIGETLVRATGKPPATVSAQRLRAATAPATYAELIADPLACWIETRFGLSKDPETGDPVRRSPAKIEEAARELARDSGLTAEECAEAIRLTLKAGSEVHDPETKRPLFAFRLHQFLSKGDTVHVTLEDKETRHRTRDYQRIQPGSGGKILLPLSFCRECGQEYMAVWRREDAGRVFYEPRQDTIATGGAAGDGYLYFDPERPWPTTAEEAIGDRRVPEAWLDADAAGNPFVRESMRHRLPSAVKVNAFGNEAEDGLDMAFIPAPFLFCLHCDVNYQQTRGKDFARLATLDQEGRSSATSLVSTSIVRSLLEVPEEALDRRARKLLTFVDNRQDASLQAGHFNDFVQLTQLRAALYRALVEAGDDGIEHEDLAARVSETIGLRVGDYAPAEDLPPRIKNSAAKTFRDVIAFQLYVDLQHGWRVTMPNLERTGLLQIEYADLDWLAKADDRWRGAHRALQDADHGRRAEIMKVLLDEMRRELAIDVQYFRDDYDTLRLASEERLIAPWILSDRDRPPVTTFYPVPGGRGADRSIRNISGRGKFGKYLRDVHFKPYGLSAADTQVVITDLLEVLADAQLITRIEPAPRYPGRNRRPAGPATTGYRVSAAALIWRAGSGERGVHDPLTRRYASGEGPRVNPFFRALYQNAANSLAGMSAREHTAQVDPLERERREERFREGDLKLLYCSPTMELGVDIAQLNAVMMRNVPPTPANYAQRSGRAGRSGQPALVTTYCATGNSHDQYYFRRSEQMVSGVVAPPRLDLANEDLVRSHVQAIWLAEAGLKLGQSIPQIIDISHDEDARRPNPALPLQDSIAADVHDEGARRRAVAAARKVLGALREDFATSSWWDEDWLETTVRNAPHEFDRAFGRWRDLFRAALADRAEQHRRVADHTLTQRDQRTAQRRRWEAETQLALLKNDSTDRGSVLSDFNPYRYLASEGFLPGYSFPRLPLAAYVHSSSRRSGDGDYLQRPRFLAIREFGPGALIYHEGSRYQVTRIQLPPEADGDVATTSAKRCESCGYHHNAEDLRDRCLFCKEPLTRTTTNLLRLHTVYTTRRERISSDEEERRRAGFRIMTSFCFVDHGDRPGRRDSRIRDTAGEFAKVMYGDSATVRLTNIGRMRAAKDEPPGYDLDPANGRWMNSKEAAEAAGDSDEMPQADAEGNEKRRKKRVIPYVEDSRNILVLELARPLPEEQALSLMYALERGIEAAFELEDSELASELLPPDDGDRDRMLFMEAAEGGAGVLRLMQADDTALQKAARTALEICHFDAAGNDLGGAAPDRLCAKGCYECLLTYGNQIDHGAIDRHSIRDLLLRFADGTAEETGRGESRTDQMERLREQTETSLEDQWVTWLKDRGLRMPDEAQTFIGNVQARPDFIYRLAGVPVAVFVDGPVHDRPAIAYRDAEAEERLLNDGWEVVRFPYDGDWQAIADQHPNYFGRSSDS